MSLFLTKSMRNCIIVSNYKGKLLTCHGNHNNKPISSQLSDIKRMMRESDPTPSSSLRKVIVIPGKGLPPEPPTTCCMSGCPTCVWLEYAAQMTEYYRDGGTAAIKAIDQIDDENVKSFIKLELKLK